MTAQRISINPTNGSKIKLNYHNSKLLIESWQETVTIAKELLENRQDPRTPRKSHQISVDPDFRVAQPEKAPFLQGGVLRSHQHQNPDGAHHPAVRKTLLKPPRFLSLH